MSLFRLVAERLAERNIPFAAIGAAALARHGVSRSTFDVDLLTTDPRTLDASLWDAPSLSGAAVEVRRGELLDPLAGVVRVRAVDSTLGALSPDAAALWNRIREDREG